MAYWMFKAFSRLVCICSPALRRSIGNFIGTFTWMFIPEKRKKMAIDNIMLSLNYSEMEAKRIAERSWTRFGRMIVDVMAFPKIKQDIAQYASVEGKEHLDQALSFGNGAVLATAHSGNWEMIGAALGMRGYPMVGVAQKQTNADMDRLINEYRTLVGVHVTYKNGVREMIRLLGQGKVIGMVMDQDAGRDGVILDFFGRKASCPQGPAFLARLKKAPIVPAFITENPDGTHCLFIKECIWVEESADKSADVKNATKRLTAIIESHVRQYPEEWFWLHDRWKYTRQNHIE